MVLQHSRLRLADRESRLVGEFQPSPNIRRGNEATMRTLFLFAILTCLATPLAAQDWSGQALAPESIGNLPGPNFDSSTARTGPYDVTPSYVQPLQYTCTSFGFFGPTATPGPCVNGGVNSYTPPVVNGTTQPSPQSIGAVPSGATAVGSLVGVTAGGAYPDAAAPGGVSYFSANIPLTAFATSQSVSALNTRMNGFIAAQQAFNASVVQTDNRLTRGLAMAAALALEGPIDGRSNRIAIGGGTFGRREAISLNYSHRQGPYDAGIAVSYSGGDALGKAAVGFSW
jgi:hypothetical protein